MAGRDDDRAGLAAAHEQAAAVLAEITAQLAGLRAAERRASAERAALTARADALAEGIRAIEEGVGASAALLAGPDRPDEVLGAVASLLTVADGAQEAITAALGGAADAIAVAGLDAAVTILRQLKAEDAGTTALVIAGHDGDPDPAAGISYPAGVVPAHELVKAPAELSAALGALLAGVAVADDLDQARSLVREHPELRVVTRDGDLLGAHWAQGGAARPAGVLAMRSAADAAADGLAAVGQACQLASAELTAAAEAEEQAQQAVAQALAALQQADAAAAATSGELGRLAGAARAAQEEAARLAAAINAARAKCDRDEAALAGLAARLTAEENELPGQPAPAGQDGLGRGAPDGRGAAPDAVMDGAVPDRAVPDRAVLDGALLDGAGAPEVSAPQGAAPEVAVPDGTVPEGAVPDRDGLAALAAAARETETGARLEVRTAEERLRAIAGRADALAAAAVAERRAAVAAAERRERRREQAQVASAVAQGAQLALTALAESLAVATADRQVAEQAREGRSDALKAVRVQVRELAAGLDRVVDSAHGAEIVQAERRMRLEQLAGRAAEEFGVDPDSLTAEYGPDVPIPPPAGDGPGGAGAGSAGAGSNQPDSSATDSSGADGDGVEGNGAGPSPTTSATGPVADGGRRYVRAEQERRAAAAQRQLDQLGKVNPLALEEYAALEERHAFLAAQLEDLKKTRRDLLTVIKEVDDRVQQVFAAAFEDTAREFEDIFGRLFPGGQGRLILIEPDDMLATGIDFEARPPGKKVKRLSLLSGGERSLTAIAFLVAIFKARPSPFYVLDEVEAALDDTNLQRLLQIFEELRATSQLLVVTHQKRTMEAADALYGISMQGDGVSTVVSQRLREPEHT